MNTVEVSHQIKCAFNKAAATYDRACRVQNYCCDKLLNILLNNQHCDYHTVIDLACGTGESTSRLLTHLQLKRLLAVDFSPTLLAEAQQKLVSKPVDFLLADFDCLDPTLGADLLFCNMGLQWSLDLATTLQNLLQVAAPNGVLAFAMPIASTFPELKPEFKNKFFTLEEVNALLLAAGWQVLQTAHASMTEYFSSTLSALRSIKYVGAGFNFQRSSRRSLVTPQYLDRLFVTPTLPQLTYHLGFFVAINNRS